MFHFKCPRQLGPGLTSVLNVPTDHSGHETLYHSLICWASGVRLPHQTSPAHDSITPPPPAEVGGQLAWREKIPVLRRFCFKGDSGSTHWLQHNWINVFRDPLCSSILGLTRSIKMLGNKDILIFIIKISWAISIRYACTSAKNLSKLLVFGFINKIPGSLVCHYALDTNLLSAIQVNWQCGIKVNNSPRQDEVVEENSKEL